MEEEIDTLIEREKIKEKNKGRRFNRQKERKNEVGGRDESEIEEY